MPPDAGDPVEQAAIFLGQINRGIKSGRSIATSLIMLAEHARDNGGLSNVGIDREKFLRMVFWDYANRTIVFLGQALRESSNQRIVRSALGTALSQIDGMIHPERRIGELDKLGIDPAHVRALNSIFATIGMSTSLQDAVVLHSQGQNPEGPITTVLEHLRRIVPGGNPEALAAIEAKSTATPAREATGTRRQPRRPRRSGNRPRPPRKPRPS